MTNMKRLLSGLFIAVALFSGNMAHAQQTYEEIEQLTVNEQVTTVITASEPIRFVDISTDLIAGDQPINNTVRLKPKNAAHEDGAVLAIVTIVTERYRTQYALVYTTRMTEAVIDKDGWLHTGDMGTISNAGTIFIKGRCKTMILSANGQNIYPEEIEAKLNNMPYVAESLVVQRGHKLVALVYPDYEAMDKVGLSHEMMPKVMEKVREEVNRQVAPYEKIDEVQLRASEFEKTPKRSIKRFLYS